MKTFFTLILSGLLSFSAFSTHIIGSEITYRHITGNDYRFQIKYWVDCSSMSTVGIVILRACSPSCAVNASYSIPPVSSIGTPIFPACSWPNSVCVSGPDYGIKEYVFVDTITLTTCSDWTFFVELCCRNASITNILNPLSTGMNVRATLNNLIGYNTSALISNAPVAFACCNVANTYSQLAAEPDGDSLSYTLYNAFDDGMTCNLSSPPITYVNPYTYLQFISTQTPITFNSGNGNLFLHPNICSQSSVVGIRVNEYRGNTLVGSMTRDISILVTPQILGTEELPFGCCFNQIESEISFTSSDKASRIEVYDVSGKLIIAKECKGLQKLKIDLPVSGIYFCTVFSENVVLTTQKFVR